MWHHLAEAVMPLLADRFTAALPAGADYDLERLVVVSAYTSEDFLPKLVKELRPASVHVVLDESTPRRVIESIGKGIGKKRLRRLALGMAPRLMHAKLYLLTWIKKGGSNRVHHLHFGSANASDAAFVAPGNAETFAHVRVLVRHAEVLAWFDAIAGGADRVTPVACDLDGLHLELPAFEIRDPNATPQFDAWLQRGWLCHKYQRDPAFLRLSVALESPLPRDEIATAFEEAGLIDDDGRRHLRFAYLPQGPLVVEPRPPTRWMVRHFVDTLLGAWTSDRCFTARHKEFFLAGRGLREAEIALVARADNDQRERWRDGLLRSIRQLEARLGPDRISEWLKVVNGHVDLDHYGRAAAKQLTRDFTKASNKDYRERYVQGVDFLPVPRFRAEHDEWEAFALSFAEVLTYQLQKGKVDSRIAHVMLDANVLAADDTGEDALQSLRDRWPDVCEQVEEMLLEGMTGGDA